MMPIATEPSQPKKANR